MARRRPPGAAERALARQGVSPFRPRGFARRRARLAHDRRPRPSRRLDGRTPSPAHLPRKLDEGHATEVAHERLQLTGHSSTSLAASQVTGRHPTLTHHHTFLHPNPISRRRGSGVAAAATAEEKKSETRRRAAWRQGRRQEAEERVEGGGAGSCRRTGEPVRRHRDRARRAVAPLALAGARAPRLARAQVEAGVLARSAKSEARQGGRGPRDGAARADGGGG